MSEQAVTFLRTLNSIVYSVSLSEALSILDAALLINPAKFDWNNATLDAKVAQAKALPEVMQHIGTTYETSKKIQAIKVLRDVSKMGLKESKDVIDALTPPAKWRFCCNTQESRLHDAYCYNS